MTSAKRWTAVIATASLLGVVWGAGCGGGGGTTSDASACPGSQTLCGSECSDLTKDPGNCGACGKSCGAGTVCSSGSCAASCGSGLTACGQSCTSTQNDPLNCGACGTKCTSGQACAAGKCVDTCGASQVVCSGECVDTQTDRNNCGGCTTVCGPSEVCSGGKCGGSCQAGLTFCTAPAPSDAGGTDSGPTDAASEASTLAYPYCANFQSDNENCGGCGIVCPGGTTCSNGSCANSCPSQDGGTLTLCTPDGGANYCADTKSDPSNCGGCGVSCGMSACVNGVCNACAWDPTTYTWPILAYSNNNYFGGITFDQNCNILVAGGFTKNVYSISKSSGTVTTAATGFTNSANMNGIVYRASDGTVYVTMDTSNELFAVVNGVPTGIIALPTIINDIAVVPPGFGSYAGQLIGVGVNGQVYILDTTAKTATSIGTTSGELSSVVMAPDGSVAYMANYTSGKVQTMTSAGVFADLVTGITNTDGLAITLDGATLYATMSDTTIQKVNIAAKTFATYANATTGPGYYVTGMKVDAAGHLFVITSSGSNAYLNHY